MVSWIFYFAFIISILSNPTPIFIICFLLLTLDFISSFISSSFKCRVYLSLFLFLEISLYRYKLPSSNSLCFILKLWIFYLYAYGNYEIHYLWPTLHEVIKVIPSVHLPQFFLVLIFSPALLYKCMPSTSYCLLYLNFKPCKS